MFALAGRLMLLTRPEAIGAILQLFFDTAVEVCEGQQMDMNFEQRDDVSSEGYLEMIRLKTAVLIASSLKIGALAAGAAGETAGLFYQFGLAAGMAFQLQDDLLDTFGDEGAFGKMSGGDIAANKKTYLYITAMQEANSAQKRRLQELYHSQPQDPSGKIKEVRELFLSLAVPARVSEKMKEYHSAAHEHLSMLTELTGPSAILSEFVDTVISRSQ